MSKRVKIDYYSAKDLPEFLGLLRKNEVADNVLWRYIDKYLSVKARDKGIPFSGQFELTPLCNLDCKMCYVHLKNDQLKGLRLLSAEWWKNLISKAHSLGMMNAVLTGGECLTYPGFDEVYLFLRSIGVKTYIKTNGVLLNKERIAFFKKYPPSGITISLYGSTNEVYNQVTGHLAFDNVHENILQAKNADLPLNIAITPNTYMYDDVTNIVNLSIKLGISYSINAMLFPPRKETGREISDLSAEKYLKIFKSLRTESSHDIVSSPEADSQECDTIEPQKIGLNCSAGKSFFNVSWNGIMSGCTNLDSLNVSLLETDFETAWKKINIDAISYPLPIECVKCKYNNLCFNCTAYRQKKGDKNHCNPEVCERTKLFVNEGIYQM